MSKSAWRLLLPLAAAALLLLSLGALGRWARESLRQEDRYRISFAAIQCQPPPGPEQADLLSEVQYLSGLSDQLALLDDDLAERLRDAFAKHPWVESVQEVKIAPRRIEVRLRYRKPVLAVQTSGQLRAVGATGVLLPATANTHGLPIFSGTALPPQGPAGTPWGDAAVEAAARAAAAR
jgi:hypothetical protein